MAINNPKVIVLAILVFIATARCAVCQPRSDEPRPRVSWPERPAPERPRKPLARQNRWVFEYRFTSKEKRLLTPSLSDQQRYASFLALNDTGLVRLYPWARRGGVVSIEELQDQRTPEFNSHACLYSFTKERHGNALNGFVDPRLGWAELKFGEGKFFTGFTGESLGVLVALGDMPIEAITPNTEGVSGLTNIQAPADYLEAAMLSKRNRAGFEMAKFRYGSSLPVLANTTYVMRTTSNKRADLLVAFRVVRVASDGAVTIVWRKLKTYPKPSWRRREGITPH